MNDEDGCHSRFVIQALSRSSTSSPTPEAVLQMHELAPDVAVKGKLTHRDLTREPVAFEGIEGSLSDALQVFPGQFCNCVPG